MASMPFGLNLKNKAALISHLKLARVTLLLGVGSCPEVGYLPASPVR